jgi:hypothetical protein
MAVSWRLKPLNTLKIARLGGLKADLKVSMGSVEMTFGGLAAGIW